MTNEIFIVINFTVGLVSAVFGIWLGGYNARH